MWERVYKKPISDLAQMNQRLEVVWADFEHTIVDKRQTIPGNDSGPVSSIRDSTLTHDVTSGGVHCLQKTHCLNDCCYS